MRLRPARVRESATHREKSVNSYTFGDGVRIRGIPANAECRPGIMYGQTHKGAEKGRMHATPREESKYSYRSAGSNMDNTWNIGRHK